MISAIVLAAGQSKRMIGENKLIKKYKKKYLINYILENLIKSKIKKIIVVLGFESIKVKKKAIKNKKIIFIFNKKYKSGMSSSIKFGIKKIPKKSKGFLIIQADMPLVSKKILDSLCEGVQNNSSEIIVPVYEKRMGNPVGFQKSMAKVLNKTKGDIGAKNIIKKNKNKITLVKVNSKSIFKNFNSQKDFLINF